MQQAIYVLTSLAPAAGLFVLALLVRHPRFRFLKLAPILQTNLLLFNLIFLPYLFIRHMEVFQPARLYTDPALGLLEAWSLQKFLKLAWLYSLLDIASRLLQAGWFSRFRKIFGIASLILAALFLAGLGLYYQTGRTIGMRLLIETVDSSYQVIGLFTAICLSFLPRRWKLSPQRTVILSFGQYNLGIRSVSAFSWLLPWTGIPAALEISSLISAFIGIFYNLFFGYWALQYTRVFYEERKQAVLSEGKLEAFATSHGLSRRELEVLRLLADGKSNKEIAGQLCISLATVKDHIYNMFQKTGGKNRTDMVQKALQYTVEAAGATPPSEE